MMEWGRISSKALVVVSALMLLPLAPPAVAGPECGEPNDRLPQVCSMQLGETVTGGLASRDDVDTYLINVPAGTLKIHARVVCPTVDCDLAIGGILPNGMTKTLGESHKFGPATEANPEEVEADVQVEPYPQYYVVVNVPTDLPADPWDPASPYVLTAWGDGGRTAEPISTPTESSAGQSDCPAGVIQENLGVWRYHEARPPLPLSAGHCELIVAHGDIKDPSTGGCNLRVFGEGEAIRLGEGTFRLWRFRNGSPEQLERVIEGTRLGAEADSQAKSCPRI